MSIFHSKLLVSQMVHAVDQWTDHSHRNRRSRDGPGEIPIASHVAAMSFELDKVGESYCHFMWLQERSSRFQPRHFPCTLTLSLSIPKMAKNVVNKNWHFPFSENFTRAWRYGLLNKSLTSGVQQRRWNDQGAACFEKVWMSKISPDLGWSQDVEFLSQFFDCFSWCFLYIVTIVTSYLHRFPIKHPFLVRHSYTILNWMSHICGELYFYSPLRRCLAHLESSKSMDLPGI